MQQQMTYQDVLQGLFDALTDLKTAVTKHGYTPNYGIGMEVYGYWEEQFGESTFDKALDCLEGDAPSDLLADLMEPWPEGTGCCAYPIPAARGCISIDAAYRAFRHVGERWAGEQLELRLELLDYIIEQLEETTNASK